MAFYVLHHRNRRERVCIHKGACAYCRDGNGPKGKPQSETAVWSRLFKTVVAAKEYVRTKLPRRSRVAICKRCKPGLTP
jgi:hypothetical protein